MNTPSWHLGLTALLSAWLCACGAEPYDPAQTGASGSADGTQGSTSSQTPTAFERDLEPKLAVCQGCHRSDNPGGLIVLTDMWTQVDATSAQLDMPLIDSGDHLNSYLWHKVAGTHGIVGGQGQRMPVSEPWPEEDIELLGQWIDLGLPR